MITYTVEKPAHGTEEGGIVNYVEGSCLSTDDKPEDVANGSVLFEMDTGIMYKFDEENTAWRAW